MCLEMLVLNDVPTFNWQVQNSEHTVAPLSKWSILSTTKQ